MPQFARALDVYQGFNHKHDKQTSVGFITELKIGGVPIAADLESLHDPKAKGALKGVAVLNHYLWETGFTDAMYFSGQVSVNNKTAIQTMLMQDWKDTTVEFKYVLFEYDQVKKVFYESNKVTATMHGLLEKNGQELNLNVADDASHEVQSPLNFTFQIGIKPATTAEQEVHIAVADGKNIVKKWGIKAAA